ncbi:hypothetical protein L210DRAFT_3643479 [Boletus edulis BED1]|uniref:Uncharacterized protein n=1 Tax=Boletus edulis BED1 TaxID=1328754 RepID=A0AAD4GHD5_BOLED|nr:hypothetical protein L210DRAFT_3643479 [Boletus edulis BED1]
MSNQSETPPNLRLHISDLQDILASIALDQSADVESVWYEYWNCILNYWTRRSSDGTTRLSVAPQRQLIREILVDKTEVDVGHDWSFEADPGDTSMETTSGSGSPPGIQERIDDAQAGIDTESRIPDFVAFALRRHGLPHRRLVCILEIKSYSDDPRPYFSTVAPQIITQAKFAFDSFPDLRHVLSIIAFGDSWSMYRFPRNELNQLYLEDIEGYGDNATFNLARASRRPRNVDISKYVVVPFSKVLKADGSNYTSAFERAIGLVTAGLKARTYSLKP